VSNGISRLLTKNYLILSEQLTIIRQDIRAPFKDIPLPKEQQSRPPQARGEARRRKLLDAVIELLDERELADISLSDVAKQADVPLGSIYFHYKSINELSGQVLVSFRDQLADEIGRPYRVRAKDQWGTLIEKAIERIFTMSQTHQAFVQVALNRHAPVEVRYESGQKGGWEFVPIFKEIIARHFVLPDIPKFDRAILNFVDIVDALFVRSVEENGAVDEETLEEAKRAGVGYLRLYLPEYLPRQLPASVVVKTGDTDA
jgi:AcrR family transcriptional regulator